MKQKGLTLIEVMVGVVILAIVAMLAISLLGGGGWMKKETVVATVTDKERIHTESGGKYLIYTNVETFQNTDDMFESKHNSSDFYGRIQKDSTYSFLVKGKRVPMFSMYRNIISFRKVSRNEIDK